MKPTRRWACQTVMWVAAGLIVGPKVGRAQSPAEPDGYRQDGYGAPTPATLLGAPALTTAQANALWTLKNALFIDVLPHASKPQGLPDGTIWHEKPHTSIPGAIWLPDVGRGALASETETYFKQSLETVTSGDHDRPLVFFCKRSCWMSWNAAKRAESFGYTHVSWYADGVEGWTEAALPLQAAEPRPSF